MTLTVDIRKALNQFELRTSFTCRSGELTVIVGPSGSGKTTLIRILAGLDEPDAGSITLNGTTWLDTNGREYVPTCSRKIGLVFQEYALFPHLTVRQNIAFGAADEGKIDGLMSLFGIDRLERSMPDNISGGERQRTALCQALAREPDLLMLDEPFSALDVATRSFLCDLLAVLKRDLGIPILHVTHDLQEAKRLGDAVIAVERGRITPDWLERQHIPGPRHDIYPAPSYP